MFTHLGTQLHKKMLAIIACVVLCVSVCTYIGVFAINVYQAQAAFNEQINYQGKLTGTTNIAVADGTYNMRFWLLQSTGQATTSAVWTESLTGSNRVQVTNGLFSIMLGSSTPFTGVDFNQTLYLGVEIGGTAGAPAWDGEMSPRKILGAVPAAFEAKNFGGASSTQYLRSDRATVLATTTASTLLTIIQNGTGDLLNIFDGVNEVFSILDGGNVGVGSSSPTLARFVVGGDSYLGGNVTATGTLALTGLGTFNSGFVSNASSSISKLSVQFGTTTNATSTFFVTQNATATNLFATNLNVTNATTTNFFTAVFGATTASFANLLATNGTTTNATSTNLYAAFASSTNLAWLNATGTSLTTVNATSTRLFVLNGNLTNATATNLFATFSSSTNFRAQNASTSNLYVSGNVGIASTSPLAKLSIHANVGDTLTTLFAIGSSTSATTTNLLTVDNTGSAVFANSVYDRGIAWTPRTASDANQWRSVTYGNGLFVTVSSNGTNRVMTSPDGINWTTRGAAAASSWQGVTYGNGVFVAISSSGTNRVMTSPDGITWTLRSASDAYFWQSVTYGNGVFVAVSCGVSSCGDAGSSNQVMTSPDGITWTSRTSAETNQWNKVAYGNGKFVAIADNGTNRVMYSPDGIVWTAASSSEQNGWQDIVYGNGLFAAVSSSGTNRVMTSPDGITWTARSAAITGSIDSIAYGNGIFVATGNPGRGMTSPDGVTWTARETAPSGNSWNDVTYGNGVFVAVTSSGTTLVMTSGKTYEYDLARNNIFQGGLNAMGSVSVGTTTSTSSALLGLYAYATSSNYTTLFNIASGTAQGVVSNLFSISNTGSTTIANGVNITAGCYAVNNVCIATGSGISSLNGITSGTQVFATSSNAGGFGFSTSSNIHTLNIPLVGSTTDAGLLSAQNFKLLTEKVSTSSINTSALIAALVSDETGTGNLVFSANPTFTGTAVFANLTAQNGTTTNSTSTNLFANIFRSTSATTTNFAITGVNANGVLFTDANGTVFATTSLTDAYIADDITVSNGNILGGNISGTLVTTGTLTIGDGGDRIDINSSGWDVTNSVFTGGTWNGNVINPAYGGTGNSAIPQDGEILIGDGIGYTLTTLTAGAGISITNGTGAITITNASTTQWSTNGSNIYYNTGNVGVGTSSPFARLSVMANNGDTNTNLFAIGSSTSATSTNLLLVDNTGTAVFAGPVYSKGITWTERSAAGNNDQWTNVTYGNGLFVVTGFSGDRIMTSSDGINWATTTAVGNDDQWTSLTYGNGLFVAVGQSGDRVMTSPDGINWTARSAAGNDDNWRDVTYAKGLFVAVGWASGDRVMTSPDGINWTARSAVGNDDHWHAISYNNNLFVAVGGSSGDRVMTSPDGITWTAQSAAGDNDSWSDVTYGNGLFVAVGDTGGDRVMTSPDGITWTAQSVAGNNDGWQGITYGNGLFVAVSYSSADKIITSPNGTAWTVRSAPGSNDNWNGITYGNGLFVAVGDGANYVMTSGQLEGNQLAHNNIYQGGMNILGGNVGIGTTTAAWTLQLASSTPYLAITDSDAGTDRKHWLLSNIDGTFRIGQSNDALTSTSTKLLIDSTNSSFYVGTQSGTSTGLYNNALGYQALYRNTSGSANNALGYLALSSNTTGDSNNAFGTQSMLANTTGRHNQAIGASTLVSNTTGAFNIAIGSAAGYYNTTGTNNIAIGRQSGGVMSSGHSNIMIGDNILISNLTTGSNNIGIGSEIFFPSATANRQLNIGGILFGTMPATSSSFTLPTSGGIGIGSTSPNGLFSIHAPNGYASTTLFSIGSSTAATTTTLMAVDNTGTAVFAGPVYSKGITWKSASSSQLNSWFGVTYGNGLFVAVSYDGSNQVMTSPDGVNWTARSAVGNNDGWLAVTYGNGLFVATSFFGDVVMTSPDGINWTARSAPQANSWGGITYGNGTFVAVSDSGTNRVMTSPDGINWTVRSAAGNNDGWASVVYANGQFVAVGTGSDRVMTSPDGITWTIQSAAGNNDTWNAITFGNGIFVAVGVSGDRVMTSPDGINWTVPSAAGNNDNWYGITYGNGLFVAVGDSSGNADVVMTSPDGVTWSVRSAPGALEGWQEVVYGNGVFVAVSNTGTYRAMTSGQIDSIGLAHNNIYQGGMSVMGGLNVGTTSTTSLLNIFAQATSSAFTNLFNISSSTNLGVVSNLFTISNTGLVTTSNGYISNASSSLAQLSSIYSTSTNATSTNLFATNLNTTNATTTNLAVTGTLALTGAGTGCLQSTAGIISSTGSSCGGAGSGVTFQLMGSAPNQFLTPTSTIGIAVNASSSISQLSTIFGTTTNSTSTNLFATQGNFTNATTSNLFAVTGNFTNATTSRLAITGMTAGSILFASSSGSIYQDNANFFWNDATNRLGIGSTSPSSPLSVNGQAMAQNFVAYATTSTSTFQGNVVFGQSYVSGNPGLDDAVKLYGKFYFGIDRPFLVVDENVFSGTANTLVGVGAADNYVTNNLDGGFFAYNTVVGTAAMYDTGTVSFYNTAVGNDTLGKATSSNQNVAIGNYAGYGNGSGYANIGGVYVGVNAGHSLMSGSNYNTFVGQGAGSNVTTGFGNVLLGADSTNDAYSTGSNSNLTSGSRNIAIGYNVSFASTTANGQLNIQNILFGTGNTGSASTLSTGNIGIGTTSPFARLSVMANNGDTNTTLFAIGSSTANSTSTLFNILNNGNVGIGTTSPFTALSISGRMGVAGLNYGQLSIVPSANDSDAFITFMTTRGPTDRIWGMGAGNNTGATTDFRIRDFTASADRFVIDSLGNVGIGSTTPLSMLSVGTNGNGSFWAGNSTTTNATTTNLAVSGTLSLTGAATGCLQSTAGIISSTGVGCGGGAVGFGKSWEVFTGGAGSVNYLAPTTTIGVVVNASSSIFALNGFLGTTTNATSTNLFATQANFTNATSSKLFATIGNFTNATSTNLFATFSSSTNLRAQNASTSNLYTSGIFGIGTTSPASKLAIHANIGDTITNLLTIGSSTSGTTTSLLTVDNTGTAVFAGPVYSKGITWTPRSAAGNNDGWTSVTYGNGLFVAVSYTGDRVMTTQDGINWTVRGAAGNDDNWSDVTYGNGLFVAVGNSGGDRVMTSPDGITWTARSGAGNDDSWSGVTYGNGLFVAVSGSGDMVMTSPDGITWTPRSAAGNNDAWSKVAYANGLFVAVGSNVGGDIVMTSPDGITWTAQSAAGNDDVWTHITYGNGLFVAVGQGSPGTDYVMTSPDGATWTARSTGTTNSWYSVTYGNGLFVSLSFSDNTYMTSPNGINWTIRNRYFAGDSMHGVTYGNGLFVGVGYSGSNRVMTSGQIEETQLAHNNIFQGGLNAMGSLSVGTTTSTSSALVGIYAYASSSSFTTLFNIASNTTLGGIPTNLFTISNTGNTSIAGTLGVTGLVTGTNGFYTTASSSLAQLTSIFSTSTNATSTNLFATQANFTNATSSNLAVSGTLSLTGAATGCLQSTNGIVSSTGVGCGGGAAGFGKSWEIFTGGAGTVNYLAPTTTIGIVVNASSSIFALNGFLGTTTNATSTNLFATQANFTNATSSKLFAITGNFTNATATNIFGTFSSSTNLRAQNASTSNLYTSGIFGIGTTSPASKLAIHANIGDTITNLLTIGSSTSATTTSLLTVDNTGTAVFAGPVYSKGITWKAASSTEFNQWTSITYGNGLFVAVSADGTNRVMTSPDGINWTARVAGAATTWSSVTYGNGMFVAIAGAGTNSVMSSPDGINWTARNQSQNNIWNGVAYGNGMFVAVSQDGANRVMTSPDGITWTARNAAEASTWTAVTYGNGLFVAAASGGANRIMTSPDGINWTVRSPSQFAAWSAVTYGNGVYVIVGNIGTMMTSTNGITWTNATLPAANDITSITYGNGLFVAVTSNGTQRAFTSPDGVTWTGRSSIVQGNAWSGVTYGNGTFVAVALSGPASAPSRVMTSGQIEQNQLATNNIFQGGMSILGGALTIGSTTATTSLLSLNAASSTSGLTNLFNISSSTAAGVISNLFTVSNTGLVTASNGFYTTASSSLAQLSSIYSTSTNATSTNLFATNLNTTNATSSNLNVSGTLSLTGAATGCLQSTAGIISSTGSGCGAGGTSFGKSWEVFPGGAGSVNYLAPTTTIGVVVNASSSIFGLNSIFGTTTNATSTNLFATNGNFTNATSSRLFVTVLNATNATSTNIFSTFASSTNLAWLNATGTSLTMFNATSTNFFASLSSSTNFRAQNASTSNLYTSGIFGIGTTSPYAKLSIHANNGDLQQTLFAIGSTTGTASTTNLLTVDRTGTAIFAGPVYSKGITWTSTSAVGDDDSWSGVAYGNGRYVAVGVYDEFGVGGDPLMTSTDGRNWATTSAGAGSNDNWSDVIYANGLFVAVAGVGDDKVMTSPDGLNWTARAVPGGGSSWGAITYGNGRFVAVSDGNSSGADVMTSPDGINWTAYSVAEEDDNWFGVTYGNGLFVAVSFAGDDIVMTSPDGITWTTQSSVLGNNDGWGGITYANDLFVAVGSSGDRVMTSSDGLTWTARNAAGDDDGWADITYGNGLFVATGYSGDRVMTSPDGINWTARSAAGNNDGWFGVTYGNGRFVAVGGNGTDGDQVMTSGQPEEAKFAYNNIFQGGMSVQSGSFNVGTTSTTTALLNLFAQATSSTFTNLFNISSSTNLGVVSNLFSISNTGSTTAANGFNITNGCYAVNGICLTSGGGGASFGQSWEVFAGGAGSVNYLAPTSTIGIVVNASSTIFALNGRFGTTTNATSTNLFATHGNFTNATSSKLFAITGNFTNATATNLFASFSSSTNFRAQNASTSNLYVSGLMGIGTTSPASKLAIHANVGDTLTTLFAIGSSTSATTTSLLTVDNTGTAVFAGPVYSKGVTWTSRSAAGDDDNWTSITYGNGMFVAVATTTDRLMTSPDGVTWTVSSVLGDDDSWSSITYGNGMFVAVAQSGTNRVITSPDGIAWTARSAANNDDSWNAVTYGNGRFVAVSSAGDRVITSPDGIAWTARSAAGNNDSWFDVTYGNGLFVAVGITTGTDKVMTSPDGITWTIRSAAGDDDNWNGITYGNGMFVAVANAASGDHVMTSADGITWTARPAAGDNDFWADVTYGNGLFVAVGTSGDRVITSPDGITWSVRTATGNNGSWNSVTYGNGRFVAVGGLTGSDKVITSGQPESSAFALNNIFQGGMSVLGGTFGVGTTSTSSPAALLSIHAQASSSALTSLFNIASSSVLGGASTNLFTISNTGSTTAANGFNITNGCYAVNGTCLSTGGANFFTNSGSNTYLTTGTKLGIGTSTPYWDLQVASTSPYLALTDTNAGTNNKHWLMSNIDGKFAIGTSSDALNSTSTRFVIDQSGNVGIGTTSPTSLLGMEKTAVSGNGVAGISQYFNFQNSVGSAVQYGDSTYIVNAPTTANTLVGKVLRIEDNTALVNTVRGLEVQAHRGTNTQGENTAISGFGRTFGVRGTTEGDAGSIFEPAGIYGETRGTAQSNAIRGYSGTITSSDLFALEQGSSTFTGTGLAMNFGNTGGSFNASTSRFLDLKNAGVTKFVVMASGTVGIGTSTPWGFLSINPNDFAGPSFVIGSSTKTDFIVANTGQVGIGNISGFYGNSLVVNGDEYIESGSLWIDPGQKIYLDVNDGNENIRTTSENSADIVFTTNGVDRMFLSSSGGLGIGSSSPFAKLTVISSSSSSLGSNENNPLFWFATTSSMGVGRQPIIWGFATTTGDLNRERVAIGTTSVWGTGGIRDSLTVDGRIYSTWMQLNCVAGSSAGIATVVADTSGVCGDFGYDFLADASLVSQASYPPKIRMRAGIAASLAANEGSSIRTVNAIATATSSPVMEARVGIPRSSQVSTSTRTYTVGFTSTTFGTTTLGTAPTNGVYFSASSTLNWQAVIRRNNVETSIDTGVPTTSVPNNTGDGLQRMRIEVTGTNATFLIDGTVRAVLTPGGGMPIVPLAAVVSVTKNAIGTGATNGALNISDLDISYIQVWVDDPVGADATLAEAGIETLIPQQNETGINYVRGADIAENYFVASSSTFVPGMLVAHATTSNMLDHTYGAYDPQAFGVVTTDPHTVLGQSDSGLIRMSVLGRVPVIVSLENGPIQSGDAIVASAISSVGMRANRPGQIVGRALESASRSQCDSELEDELEKVGVELPQNVCVARILVSVEQGFSVNVPDMFTEISTTTDFSMMGLATELAHSAYEKGAELTRFVVGQVTAQVAFIGQIFSNEVHTKSLCVADDAGNETCLTKGQLDALILNAGSGSTTITPPPPPPDDGGGTGGGTGGGGTTTPDTEAPVVNLIGPSTVTVTVDASYNDEGATVSDNIDTNLSYITLVDGTEITPATFDLHTPAVHTITYRATDTAGNVEEVTRTVEVVPAPTPQPEPEPEPQPEPTDPPPAEDPPPTDPPVTP